MALQTKESITPYQKGIIATLDLEAIQTGASGTDNTIAIGTLPKGHAVTTVVVESLTYLSGGAVSDATAQVDVDSVSLLGTAHDVFDGHDASYQPDGNFDRDAEQDIDVVIATTGANISVLTAGEIRVTVYFRPA